MTRDTRLMWGITLITVPTIVFGGLAVLGVVSGGRFGLPAPPDLTPLQVTFYRSGHAHAGVLMILSLLLQSRTITRRSRAGSCGHCEWAPPRRPS